ncbi:sushi, von Willebrand factor type A, EGF and pentraxin domain-containing protein 1-like isoform X2 [Lycorma delicatula]|uniref:sushi, von Willebrand factor type A, EGF and pentraxin domain-containing protein 1-like isoform X2 n=1 Tax=Lycorma delicatula TaxID=130591 RepID=UPI003F513AFD
MVKHKILFGQKKKLKDVSSKLENSILKSKVDALGEVLKKRVDILRTAEKNHPLELIFLVDASSSVGAENFKSELKFVKKLLADFTISSSHTRVALISFASAESVVRHIDHISVSDVSLNKCSLMNQHINYSGGATYTLGAMLQAKEIFSNSRSGAHCALFLVTDGFSNGGDPRPVAKELRASGVTIFTFGISTGNRAELYDMASVPGHEHSFLLDSFNEFEALARRALHEDLATGYYETVEDESLCGSECSSEARCTCGLRTGHYACLCPPGFYGSALLKSSESCTLCPNGTYNDGSIPGDVTVCIPCPDVNHVTYGPAKSPKDCYCKQGFKPSRNSGKCQMVHCPELDIPENGYMIQGWCSTVMNAGCGIRCNVGYSLVGSSVRLCLPNGTWSGSPTECVMKRCPRLQPPENGNITCTFDDGEDKLPLDSECNVSCTNGYTLTGSTKRTCLPLSKWDGIPNKCRIIQCRSLPEITSGYYNQKNCTSVKKHEFGTVCKINCYPGYELNGPDTRKCAGKGTWTNKREITTCIDMTPPLLQCPSDITVVTEPEEGYAWVKWTEPQPQDNSNESVVIWTLPATEQPMKLGIGMTLITYVATDVSFNQAVCNFTITVIDDESPIVSNCDFEEPYTVSKSELSDIKWLEPEFHDNSLQPVKVITSHKLEELPVGTTQIKYTAFDPSGNNNSCILTITVIEDTCKQPNDPLHGKLNCTDDIDEIGAVSCSVICDEGYAITTENNSFKYNCDNLTYSENDSSTFPDIPDCAEAEIPNSIIQDGSLSFETSSDNWCNSSEFINQISTAVKDHLESACLNDTCKIYKPVNVECENIISGLEEETNKILGRRRRETQKTTVNIKFSLQRKKDEKQLNAKQNLVADLAKDKIFSKVGLIPTKNLNIIWKNEWPACSSGFVAWKKICVKCPSGASWNGQSCIPCQLGWYQPMAGQKECLKCPDFTSTRKTRARNMRACKPVCPPGTYSRSKGKGRLWKTGEIGVIPCLSCPVGTYQPNIGAITCLHCNGNLTTRNKGSLSHDKCIIHIDKHCQNVSCQNGGICKLYKGHILCSCPKGYFGSYCEKKLDLCLSRPCLQGGTCYLNSNGYSCSCPAGFKGKHCEEEIDECLSNPCQNSGECVDLINEFHCHCPPSFYGSLCEFKLDECEAQPCADGAQCVSDLKHSYRCLCGNDYSGKYCEISPCQIEPRTCHNNSTCHTSFNSTHQSYRCECNEGWTGQYCDVQVNPCDSAPCKNSGYCIYFDDGKFTCTCQHGYYGATCDEYVSPDFSLNFPSPGTLNYLKANGPDSPMDEVGLCMWVQSSFIQNYGTLFSYATVVHDNSFTLTDYNGLVLYVNGKRIITDIRVNDGLWHSVCVEWLADGGLWNIYLDGQLQQSGSGLSNNSFIPGHGIIVIGQDQDRIGGGFNPTEALVGRVAGVDLWNHVLTETTVLKHAEDCSSTNNNSLVGNVLSWSQLRYAIHGGIQIDASPLCKGCSSPFTPQFSTLKLINSGSVAIYTCDKGYVIDKRGRHVVEHRRKCLKDGSWQGNSPVCQRCYCGYPGYFPHGKIKGDSYYYLDKIFYECDSDYKLVGSFDRQCLPDGKWSGKQPSCQADLCPYIDVPKYSNMWMVIGDSYHMEFECVSGYLMNGNSLLTCLSNGQWDSKPPVCNPINCTKPQEIDDFIPETEIHSDNMLNYPVGSVVRYSCKPGFKSDGDSTDVMAVCKLNGNWDLFKQDVNCIRIPMCSPLTKIEHGSVVTSSKTFNVGTQVIISCDLGYKVSGSIQRTCLNDFSWAGDESVCLPITCPQLSKFVNITSDIELNEENVTFGAISTAKCISGLQLLVNSKPVDSVNWTCSKDGVWQTDFDISDIKCLQQQTKKECSTPEAPLHGYIPLLPEEIILHPVGSTFQLQCRQGYLLNGTSETVCLNTGIWSHMNKTSCQAVECPRPPQPPNTELSLLSSLQYGSLALHKCIPGYQGFGIFAVHCQANRQWSRFRGKCIRLSCGKPEVHPEAVIEGDSYLYGENLTISCPPDTIMEGNPITICQADGMWSNLPKCNNV